MNKSYKKQWIKESLIICALVLITSMIVFRRYIFEGYYLLSQGVMSDTLRANLPTYIQMYDSLFKDHNFWSWKMGIGTSMFTHADVYFDPFVYILFIKGREGIQSMLVWMMIIKLIVEALAMGMYLRFFNLKSEATIIGAVMYAFSGYSLIMGNNFALGTILVYVPLVCLGIEKWLKEGTKKLLIISLFLTCIYSYYFFFCLGILLALYLLIRARQNRILGIPKLVSLAIIAVVVIGLSLFSILPQIELVLASDRVAGTKDVEIGFNLLVPQFRVLATAFVRSLSNDICGNRANSEYWGYAYNWNKDYFQISTFISSIFIVLLGQFLSNKKIYLKKIGFILICMCILILFPLFPFIFNAFSTINARWMFFLNFLQSIVVALSVDSIVEEKRVKLKPLLMSVIVSYIMIFISIWIISLDSNGMSANFVSNMYSARYEVGFLSCIWLGILILSIFQRFFEHMKRSIFVIAIFGIFIIDSFYNYNSWYSSENTICEYTSEEKSSYDDLSAKIIEDIQKNDTSWYRINKNFDSVYDDDGIPSENDAMVQRYYGLKSYNSVNNSNYSLFLKQLGIYVANPISVSALKSMNISPLDVTGSQLNYINGVYDHYDVMSYLGVKYYLSDFEDESLPQYIKLIECQNEIYSYENSNYMPLAFVNSKSIGLNQFEELDYEEREKVLFDYTIVNEDSNINVNTEKIDINTTIKEKQKHFYLNSFEQDKIDFQINVLEDGFLNLTIPYDKNWHIYIDNIEVKTQKINIGLLGCKIDVGEHNVVVEYIPKSFQIGLLSFGIFTLILLILGRKIGKILDIIEGKIEQIEKCAGRIIKGIIKGKSYYKIVKYVGAFIGIGGASFGITYCIANMSRETTSVFPLHLQEKIVFIVLLVFGIGVFYFFKHYLEKNIKSEKQTETNMELFRVLCMLLMIIYDCIYYGQAYNMPYMINNKVIALMLMPIGQMAFVGFFASCCWSEIEKDFDLSYFLKIWLEVCIYILFFALITKKNSLLLIMKAFFPINGNVNLYMSAYLAFYILLPFIKKMTKDLSKIQARILLFIILDFEVFLYVFKYIKNYQNSFVDQVLLLILYYIIIWNIKYWPFKFIENINNLIFSVVIIWLIMFYGRYEFVINSNNIIAKYVTELMCNNESLIVIIGGICLLLLFRHANFKGGLIVKYCSTSLFGVLLCFHNRLFQNILWKKIVNVEEWYDSPHFIIMIFSITCMIFIVSIFIDKVRMWIIERPIINTKKIKEISIVVNKIIDNSSK